MMGRGDNEANTVVIQGVNRNMLRAEGPFRAVNLLGPSCPALALTQSQD